MAERDGKTLRIGDVARVVRRHQPLAGDAVINDGPGLMLVVEKLPWGNTLDVTKDVEQAINEMRPGLPGSRSTRRSSARPASSERPSTT